MLEAIVLTIGFGVLALLGTLQGQFVEVEKLARQKRCEALGWRFYVSLETMQNVPERSADAAALKGLDSCSRARNGFRRWPGATSRDVMAGTFRDRPFYLWARSHDNGDSSWECFLYATRADLPRFILAPPGPDLLRDPSQWIVQTEDREAVTRLITSPLVRKLAPQREWCLFAQQGWLVLQTPVVKDWEGAVELGHDVAALLLSGER